MAVADFLALFRAMPDVERFVTLPYLELEQLVILQEAFEEEELELTEPVQFRLYSLLYPDPPCPEQKSKVLLPREMVEVMEIRHGDGKPPNCRHLYNPEDDIRRAVKFTPEGAGGDGDKNGREMKKRAPNGSDVYGVLKTITEQQDEEEQERFMDEWKADRAAMRGGCWPRKGMA